MTAKLSTPGLDALKAWATGINGRYELQVIPESSDTADKLKWLKDAGRDFFQVTPSMEQAVVRFLRADLPAVLTGGGNLRAEQTLAKAADAAKATVVLRFENNGNDVQGMTALSPRYLAWKLAKGLPGLIGVAHETLRKAIKNSTFQWVKR